MTGVMTKIHERMKRLLNKKGQGIVEFALLLAFCFGIGFVARNAGLLDAFTDSLNQGVFAFLNSDVDESTGNGNGSSNSGTNTGTSTGTETGTGGSGGGTSTGKTGVAGVGSNGFDWGAEDPTKYYKKAYNGGGHSFTQVDSQADRLAADQQTLVNIANFFLGKTQNDIISLLKGKGDVKDYTADMASNQEVLLGHFVPYDATTKQGMKFSTNKGYLNKSETQNIFAWMQGIYTDIAEDKDTVVENANYNHDRLYLVSDYIVSQTWADRAGTYQENGLRVKFEYDYSGSYIYPESYDTKGAVKVIGVQLSIDPRSQHNTEVGSSQFNEQHSNGLEVHIRRVKDEDGKDKDVVTFKDTGIATTSGNNGMTNWYGDDILNNPSKWREWYVESNVKYDISSDGGTYEFKKGDIIKFDDKYFIAREDKNLTIEPGWHRPQIEYKNSSYMQGKAPSQIFSKFADNPGNSYVIENAKVSFDSSKGCYPKKSIKYRGWPVILGSGEVYLYIGPDEPKTYTGIDEENYIKLR